MKSHFSTHAQYLRSIRFSSRWRQLKGKHLYKVTLPTSIDDVVDYVIASDIAQAERFAKEIHPDPIKGWEPKVDRVDGFLEDLYLAR